MTQDDFLNHLKWRGVEFGNWSLQDKRQKLLNLAHDGLNDLSDIFGVPPAALSLNSTTAMAFGARGVGSLGRTMSPASSSST